MKDELKKELDEWGVHLPENAGRETADLPKDYFAKMQQSVLDQVTPSIEQEPTFWERISSQLSYLLSPRPALAMLGTAAVLIAFFVFIKPSPVEESLIFADISEEVLDAYMEQHVDDFDENLLAEFFSEEDNLLVDDDLLEEDLLLEEALYEFDISELEELL